MIPGRIRLIVPALSSIGDHGAIEEMFESIRGIKHVRIEPIIESIAIKYDRKEIDPKKILRLIHLFVPERVLLNNKNFSHNGELKKDIIRSLFSGALLLVAYLRRNGNHTADLLDYLVIGSTSYTVLAHGENNLSHPDVITGIFSMLSLSSGQILKGALVTWLVNLMEVINDLRKSSHLIYQ